METATDAATSAIGRLVDLLTTVESAHRTEAHVALRDILAKGANLGVHPTPRGEQPKGVFVVFSPFRFAGHQHPDPDHYPTGNDRQNIAGQNYDLEFIWDLLSTWAYRYAFDADPHVRNLVVAFLAEAEALVPEERTNGSFSFTFLESAGYGDPSAPVREVSISQHFGHDIRTKWLSLNRAVYRALSGRENRWEPMNIFGATVVLAVMSGLLYWRYGVATPAGVFGRPLPSVFWPTAAGLTLLFGWYNEVDIQRSIRAARSMLALGTAVWIAWVVLGL